MNKSGAALLLLWSLWSMVGAGLGDATTNTETLNRREQEDRLERLMRSEWSIIQNDENGKDRRRQYQPALLTPTTVALSLPTATALGDRHLQHRQVGGNDDKSKEGDDDDDKTPKSPADVVSSLISSRVSTSVSSSVAASVSAAFSTSLAQVSESASSAISSAREAARTLGPISPATEAGTPVTTDVLVTSSQAASISIDELPAVAATTAGVANSQESAATASGSNAPTQGSSLTPGAIAGLVIGIAIASSLLSAVLTYLFMRRRARQQQEPQTKFEPSSLPPPQLSPNSGSRGFMNHSHSHSLSNDLSIFQMTYTSPTPTNHNRAANSSGDFTPDMKQRSAPAPTTPVTAPPATEYPAMAQTTQHATKLSAPPAKRTSRVRSRPRPLSDPSVDDGLGPVFPVSPLSSEGDGPYRSGSTRTDRRPSPLSYEGGGGTVPRSTSARLSLARQQSLNGGQRAHLVRVGSQRSLERERHGGGSSGHLAASGQGQGHGEGLTRLYSFTTDTSENGNSTGSGDAQPQQSYSYLQPRPLVKYAVSSNTGNSSPGLQVQAPVPRRPVGPYYFEKGDNY
ncbi:uncharacterized protein F4817DRAFT_353627 [Daldinia loculata]|uniref:uncharacterized protein n=1 Tax=Daldinia loculata TaxID=103429 RepID=UPI0020C50007|nr:uncharacterized protein F4817DRAFT_353627 [Daldinia loculata]KAI1642196.1 hypothetical protein F4817DRAFT_353627 [Daldinia loculata]